MLLLRTQMHVLVCLFVCLFVFRVAEVGSQFITVLFLFAFVS